MNHSTVLRSTLDASLRRVRGDAAVEDWLRRYPDVRYDHLVAFGKAAAAMASGALRARGQPERGILITKHGHMEEALEKESWLQYIESGHPVPDANSLEAGEALIRFLESAPPGARFLVLISGGASSLVEALSPGMDLERLSRLNRHLLAEGFPIDIMNAVRRSVSRLKGGRLARYLDGRPSCALVISDVPGDNPSVIGSGPLTPSPESVPLDRLGEQIRGLLEKVEKMPVPENASFRNIDLHIVATLADARRAARAHGEEQGFPVREHEEFLDGDAAETGERLARLLREETTPAGLHIWGGETTVHLPENPGRGGRNQHLALAAARVLDGHPGIRMLACGTDGTDGATPDAGGEVDGSTLARGRDLGLDADAALAAADSGSYLEATDSLVTTGPTGTNVMDLVLAFKDEPR